MRFRCYDSRMVFLNQQKFVETIKIYFFLTANGYWISSYFRTDMKYLIDVLTGGLIIDGR